uniref:Uncharacterized protein n=1 Tax=viral metagenome TaxID=1070528 RepID=A0A6C0KWV2_9ZZZZ
MPQNIGIIIIDKSGNLSTLKIKEFNEEELYKKCNFKKPDGFIIQTKWKLKSEGKKWIVSVYAKTEGKVNMENKYDFPPPIDSKLFFGSCAIVCQQIKDDSTTEYVSLSLEQWEKFYEKLFGGFENLADTAAADEAEEDELELIEPEKKTKHGYLKDGFVVDDAIEEEYESECDEDEESDELEESGESDELDDELDDGEIEDIGSELSEEEYDYDSDEEEK